MVETYHLTQNKYSIMYRVYKDASFYGGWQHGMVPQWSPWYNYKEGGYATLDQVRDQLKVLEANKPYLKHKKEYKAVKNEYTREI
jgi:hypothetical protein